MESWIWILTGVIAFLLLAAAAARSVYELYHLTTVRYEISSPKIRKEDSLKAVFLTDLHGRRYGGENKDLLSRIRKEAPDLIVLSGDMLTSKPDAEFAESIRLHRAFCQIAPVYAAPGNHEKKMSLPESGMQGAFEDYRRKLENAGVTWLSNTSSDVNPSVRVTGLDIDFPYYNKIHRIFYPPEQMKKDLASPDEKRFNIILAHNPRFFKTYASFGTDLVLSGHYHGGAVRLGRLALISPQFRLFPRYSRGLYRIGASQMIVSAGCGSHKVNLRLFNRPEIVVITIHGNLV